MARGIIKKLIAEKGFGFIKTEGEKDLFFHCSSVEGQFEDLREGQEVHYVEGRGEKGPRAEEIQVVN